MHQKHFLYGKRHKLLRLYYHPVQDARNGGWLSYYSNPNADYSWQGRPRHSCILSPSLKCPHARSKTRHSWKQWSLSHFRNPRESQSGNPKIRSLNLPPIIHQPNSSKIGPLMVTNRAITIALILQLRKRMTMQMWWKQPKINMVFLLCRSSLTCSR